jgi:hypothetical protein
MFAFFINCIMEHAIHKYIIEKMEQIKNDFIICLQSNKKLGVVKTLRLLDMIEKTMFAFLSIAFWNTQYINIS